MLHDVRAGLACVDVGYALGVHDTRAGLDSVVVGYAGRKGSHGT